MNANWSVFTGFAGGKVRAVAPVAVVMMAAVVLAGCPGQSFLVYRVPYADGTQVRVWQDHVTHNPPDRLDVAGINGNGAYAIVAAQTGVVRYIEDQSTINCCGGSCANNYVWLEHVGGEWTKYSHLAFNSATGTAGLQVGDIVLAGQFLGYESDVGRACGQHLHFEVTVPDDPANPLFPGNGGFMDGTNRIPRFCSVPGGLLYQGDEVVATGCDLLMECIQSEESPSTVGNCQDGLDNEVCVQEINNVALSSTYVRGNDFTSGSVQIWLEWCPNADCDPDVDRGRAVHVIVTTADANDPLVFTANCENRVILETIHNVEEIIIDEAGNLSEPNVACGGNEVLTNAFARWEICEIPEALVMN